MSDNVVPDPYSVLHRGSDQALGLDAKTGQPLPVDENIVEYINLKLSALGQPIHGDKKDFATLSLAHGLLTHMRERNRRADHSLPPIDTRVQSFLAAYLEELDEKDLEGTLPALPSHPFELDRHGIARTLSLPANADKFQSSIISSYRLRQGVLHNPASDRRTTKGVFHCVEGGAPIPNDKKAVPKITFARLLKRALAAPEDLLELPFTAAQEKKAKTFVSLLLRPVVRPAIPGVSEEKTIEVRFFAPGNLVSNLDFVESIFGNRGDPNLVENDAALDEHWSGHTGCVILAPHLTKFKKAELGLPHVSEATERQKRDGMCWGSEDELYNDGTAFKLTARDERGVVVTLIADNYFGYCKKEVKTQLSYAANLFGNCEEEHAGGTIAFPSYDLGEDFKLSEYVLEVTHRFADVKKAYADLMDIQPEGHGVDKRWSDIVYVPEDVLADLRALKLKWTDETGKEQEIPLHAHKTYVLPSGYKVEMVKPGHGRSWRLIGTRASGTFCHKPCTVSGGGKSEISKSIADAIIQGPIYVSNFKEDFEKVRQVIEDWDDIFTQRFGSEHMHGKARPILSPDRSLGSVIKLLTPSDQYTDEYNQRLKDLDANIRDLVLLVKRFYREEWGGDWMSKFSVDQINGMPGHELKYDNRKLLTQFLRVGYDSDGAWRVFNLRKDFFPAAKVQTEDDISASTVVPTRSVEGLNTEYRNPSVKFIHNCEFRLFQRPDEAIHRGYDKQTEIDLSSPGSFLSNFEPLPVSKAQDLIDDAVRFDHWTQPVKNFVRQVAEEADPEYFCVPSEPRIVDGKPTKNPRYLQTRPDLQNQRSVYLAHIGSRLFRRIPLDREVPFPVNAVLPGRRNNPKEGAVPPLAVYNPIHYMDLPELFMEYIASMTGKSPSTTGAGSEGALTKAPFNALLPVVDLNNALVSQALTGDPAFLTAAGYIGPKCRVDHDISLLIPEIWSRMYVDERDPKTMIEKGHLERCEDVEANGEKLPFSRLGYRITRRFVNTFMGRIFSDPEKVLTEDMLKPELQDRDQFLEGIRTIVETHRVVADNYMEDGSIKYACPPLRALLNIMAYGEHDGRGLQDPQIRDLFKLENIISSDWYRERLVRQADVERALWQRKIQALERTLDDPRYADASHRVGLRNRVEVCRGMLKAVDDPAYVESLVGMIGANPATPLSRSREAEESVLVK